MLTKRDKGTDSNGSSLAGVLEIMQEQNCTMQQQHAAPTEDTVGPY